MKSSKELKQQYALAKSEAKRSFGDDSVYIERYLTNPYVTKVERKNAFSSPFPSVTICNPNRVHCKHLYDGIKACHKV